MVLSTRNAVIGIAVVAAGYGAYRVFLGDGWARPAMDASKHSCPRASRSIAHRAAQLVSSPCPAMARLRPGPAGTRWRWCHCVPMSQMLWPCWGCASKSPATA